MRRPPISHLPRPRAESRGGEGLGERGLSRSGGVQLAWARDRDGRKVRASRLEPADRRGRAPFTCLGCGEELVPHLGRVRAPHFAHRSGSSCPLTAPETALHLDAKERILSLCEDAFSGRRRVRALARCPECRRLAPVDVAEAGDAAEAEGGVGSLRADVLVRKDGRPALAFEVRVTHAVEPEKEAALGSAGVPAVEVDAREEWEREGEGGVDIACARSFGFGPCPTCRARARADLERDKGGEAAEIAELEGYRARGLLAHQLRHRPPSTTPSPGPSPFPGTVTEPVTGTRTQHGDGAFDAPISPAELEELAARFACPDCGGKDLEVGSRLARHTCRGAGSAGGEGFQSRPVAWRGYDGSIVALGWWARSASSPLPHAVGERARERGRGRKGS